MLGTAEAADSKGQERSWRVADGRDDRGCPSADAVRFSHRGRTIHGHLLLRGRGRRRLATVIDADEGLWKVSEAALSPSGPRPAGRRC